MHHSEAVFLANHLRLLVEWDARASVRLQLRGQFLGVFGAPPTGCISFAALPLIAASDDAVALDRTVSAGRLRDVLGDVANGEHDRAVSVPDAVTGPAELAALPPSADWELTGSAIAAEAVPYVTEAVTEFHRRVPPNADADASQRVAEEIWSRRPWADVPVRVLHTARNLGFLAEPDSEIHGGRSGTWSRLSTPPGQVFAQDDVGSLSLRLMSLN